jgi:hypothetical protein
MAVDVAAMRHITIVSLLSLLIITGLATAAPDESPGPYCLGRELEITQLMVAHEFATALCECGQAPEWVMDCVVDMTDIICDGDCLPVICGEGVIELYELCTALVRSCVVGIPSHCWSLTGWDL